LNAILAMDNNTDKEFDKYTGAEVSLNWAGNMMAWCLVSRKRDRDSNVTDWTPAIPLLYSSAYFIEFPDGPQLEYAANVITKSMYTQSDLEGNQYLLRQKNH
jgi:hypothetical protein